MRVEARQFAKEADIYLDPFKVLIFNEDIEELALYAKPFEAQDFEVHKCGSVESAMRCIEREEFDFALVDHGFPAFKGRQVIQHLVRYNHPVPLIVLAGPRDEQCCQQALELGATDYLEKPVLPVKLNAIIHNFLGTSLKGTGSEG
jgi:DNA-binding response OmpR family regulator